MRKFAAHFALLALAIRLYSVQAQNITRTANPMRGFNNRLLFRAESQCSLDKTAKKSYAYAFIMPPGGDKKTAMAVVKAAIDVQDLLENKGEAGAEVVIVVLKGTDSAVQVKAAAGGGRRRKGGLVKVIERGLPVAEKDVHLVTANKFGPGGVAYEFFPLTAFSLIRYDRVIVLHPDLNLIKPVDQLFGCDMDFLYTSGPEAVLSDSILVVRPSNKILADMQQTLSRPDTYDPLTGWFQKGIPCRKNLGHSSTHEMLFATEQCLGSFLTRHLEGYRGFLWAYWLHIAPPAASGAISPCMYNYQHGHMCNILNFGRTLAVRGGDSIRSCDSRGALRSDGCMAVPAVSHRGTHERKSEAPFATSCRPSFFLMGPRRAGTTELYVRLTRHPRVVRNAAWFLGEGFTPLQRSHTGETGFFYQRAGLANDTVVRGEWGEARRAYRDLFPGCCDRRNKKQITGESAVPYFTRRQIPAAMLKMCPEGAKRFQFVVLVKDPVDLSLAIYGQQQQQQGSRRAGMTAEEAVRADLKEIRARIETREKQGSNLWINYGLPLYALGKQNLLYEALYSLHINYWLWYFPKQTFKVVCSEILWGQATSGAQLAAVQQHLGLEPDPAVAGPLGADLEGAGLGVGGGGEAALAPSGELLKELQAFFRPWNQRLKEEWGLNLEDCGWD